jgi:hypothetical protein
VSRNSDKVDFFLAGVAEDFFSRVISRNRYLGGPIGERLMGNAAEVVPGDLPNALVRLGLGLGSYAANLMGDTATL